MAKNGLIKKLGTLAIAGIMSLASGNYAASANLPAEFSWRNNNGNWMTPVKSQAPYNLCQTFSSIGAIEAKLKIVSGDLNYNPDLSEQEIPCEGVIDYVNGGSEVKVLNYMRDNGIVEESALPFTGPTSPCQIPTNAERKFITSWNVIDENWSQNPAQNRETIKKALIEKGPLVAEMYFGEGGSFDENKIYECKTISNSNHTVIITGYKDTGNLATSYYEAKNSFGQDWNGDGYFKIGWNYTYPNYEGVYDQCNISSSSPLFVTVPGESPIIECGNGVKETGEECDDGNLINGDNCSSVCKIELPPVDTTAPTIAISSPTSGTTYNTDTTPLIVSGSASDNVGVASIAYLNNSVNGSCSGTTNWSCSIPLSSGLNNLEIIAKDAANNSGIDTLAVTYTPPVEPPVTTISLTGWSGSRYGGDLTTNENNELIMQCINPGRNSIDKEISLGMNNYSEIRLEANNPSSQPINVRLAYEAKNKINGDISAFYASQIKTLNPGDNILTFPHNSFTSIGGLNKNDYTDLEKAVLEIKCPQDYSGTKLKIRKIELR